MNNRGGIRFFSRIPNQLVRQRSERRKEQGITLSESSRDQKSAGEAKEQEITLSESTFSLPEVAARVFEVELRVRSRDRLESQE